MAVETETLLIGNQNFSLQMVDEKLQLAIKSIRVVLTPICIGNLLELANDIVEFLERCKLTGISSAYVGKRFSSIAIGDKMLQVHLLDAFQANVYLHQNFLIIDSVMVEVKLLTQMSDILESQAALSIA